MKSYIVGYTRDSKGKIQNFHSKRVSNTIHTSTGSGGNTDMFVLEAAILRQERTEEEKLRRHLHGDKDAKFSASKVLRPRTDGMSNTISTVQKDNLLLVHMRDGSTRHARIRKLTPREVLRLMDVDDTTIDKMIDSGVSKTALCKAAGNSVVISCYYRILENMFFNTDSTPKAVVGEEGMLW